MYVSPLKIIYYGIQSLRRTPKIPPSLLAALNLRIWTQDGLIAIANLLRTSIVRCLRVTSILSSKLSILAMCWLFVYEWNRNRMLVNFQFLGYYCSPYNLVRTTESISIEFLGFYTSNYGGVLKRNAKHQYALAFIFRKCSERTCESKDNMYLMRKTIT